MCVVCLSSDRRILLAIRRAPGGSGEPDAPTPRPALPLVLRSASRAVVAPDPWSWGSKGGPNPPDFSALQCALHPASRAPAPPALRALTGRRAHGGATARAVPPTSTRAYVAEVFMGEPCARVRDLSTGRSSSVLCSKGARDLSNLQCHCGCIVVVAAGQVRNQRWSKDNLVSFEISADCAQVKRRDLKSGKGFDALQ